MPKVKRTAPKAVKVNKQAVYIKFLLINIPYWDIITIPFWYSYSNVKGDFL